MEKYKVVTSQTITLQGNRIEGSMLYEQGTEGGKILFTLKCLNLPLATTVGFDCKEKGPRPPIHLPPISVTSYPSFVAGVESEVPADFTGTINYYADFKQAPPPDAQLSLQAAYVVH